MIKLGLDRFEVQALFKRSLSNRQIAESDIYNSLSDLIGDVIEENNNKISQQLSLNLSEKEQWKYGK
ncbi:MULTISPECIES: hypothetical protein [Dehalococcoides]|jgi:hypothetical protein|uniref:Uncharacterized protein n=1 Tax=Dehalococcoides mccartyi (strain VS) TaxID=311424 RepID=D2BJG7_DEHMV|nr:MULTISPECIES: hypothetical protein [Dehalococcoides]ACZ62467.1 hypothetical protein DhcVS_1368 [Dehalococcoides mccartyi VS]AHB14170.1 hypothetical protein GY50_1401 [Dehalococcoides mccartyi GY50]AII58501.1 hypothetical protein X792_07445 [Dehalococcoides mccartyi CG1]APH13110.1 hypothetical protein ASJ33_08045 [Dehalococcoides mccartyi]QYY58765.1 hypothetical protein CWV2_000732 [Dehalococcoides mccartyi]